MRDFTDAEEIVEIDLDAAFERSGPAALPPGRGIAQTVRNPHLVANDEYRHDGTRERPVADWADSMSIEDARWAAIEGMRLAIRTREGATFARLADDVVIIPVVGSQFLHDDRHLLDIPDSEAKGLSEHSWNLVVHAEGQQMLLCEDGPDVYRHFLLEPRAFVYMNVMNRHAVSSSDPADECVIVQVDGYRPDERDLALARILEVVSSRPAPKAMS